MAKCPVCETEVEVGENVTAGELVNCSQCGTELEVASLDPVTLKEAPQEEEDWGE